jgi:hypothetical protein
VQQKTPESLASLGRFHFRSEVASELNDHTTAHEANEMHFTTVFLKPVILCSVFAEKGGQHGDLGNRFLSL